MRTSLIIFGLLSWTVLQLGFANQFFPELRTWDVAERLLLHTAVMAVVIVIALILVGSGKKKFTACCSTEVLNELNVLGFSSTYMVCPMPSDVNYSKLMANPKEYQFVILDANAASGFKVDDIEHAIIQSKTANVVIRFDESTYAGRDISWMQMAFRQAGVPVYSTLQLFNLLTKYYGKN